jgi:hypothetical protein
VGILNMLKPGLYTSRVTSVQAPAAQVVANVQKADCSDMKKLIQPVIQAFVVSYCPFGLQM